MARKTLSMKGEEVDFDLLDIKAKMQKGDKPLEVKTREDFVHMKRRRRGSTRFDDLLKKANKLEDKISKEENTPVSTPKAEKPTPTQSPTTEEKVKEETSPRRVKTKRKIIKKDS